MGSSPKSNQLLPDKHPAALKSFIKSFRQLFQLSCPQMNRQKPKHNHLGRGNKQI